MNEKELRIGNYVKNGDMRPMFQIEDWRDLGMADLFSPIPLTEEWLMKFGIKEDKTHDKYYVVTDGIAISMADEKIRLIQGNFVCQLVLRELTYVHQLQNLYFALTGEELVLKSVESVN